MSTHDLYLVLLVGTGVLLLAVVSVRLSRWAGLPTLLVYLGFGLLLGEAGFGVQYEDAALTRVLGFVALAIILAEGGFTTRWDSIRPVLGRSLALATVGVAISVAVTAGFLHFLLDIDLRTSLLFGAVVSSTDAAAVFSVLRRLPIKRRVSSTLEAESGLNDPLAILLVTLLASEGWDSLNPWSTLGLVTYELVGGVLIGLLVARLGQEMLRRIALPSSGLYPVATVGIAMLSFAGAGAVEASGFAAIYVSALWLGNADLPHRATTVGFVEALGWIAQIGLFVLLGLLASPSRLLAALPTALVLGTVLLVVARPASVVLSTFLFRVGAREQAFLSWAGLRGAVPVVLATIPLSQGLPVAQEIFDVVFLLVVVFTLIQAPPLPYLARRLGVVDREHTAEISVEAAPLEDIHADVLQFEVPQGSLLHGVTIGELRLPKGAVVGLVAREHEALVPAREMRLRVGDQLLVVVPRELREPVERRLRAVSRAGRLAGWKGELGDPDPEVVLSDLEVLRSRLRRRPAEADGVG
ncbi:MAG: potassium/proton antiporter [Candidatus Nanopelagicales bacterium]